MKSSVLMHSVYHYLRRLERLPSHLCGEYRMIRGGKSSRGTSLYGVFHNMTSFSKYNFSRILTTSILTLFEMIVIRSRIISNNLHVKIIEKHSMKYFRGRSRFWKEWMSKVAICKNPRKLSYECPARSRTRSGRNDNAHSLSEILFPGN